MAGTLERHEAGIKRYLSATTPEDLAELISANLGKEGSYAVLDVDGDKQAAELISGFL